MPRSTRQNILLRHDQTLGALEKAAANLFELQETFSPQHPEYAIGYGNILYLVAQAHEFTEEMKAFVQKGRDYREQEQQNLASEGTQQTGQSQKENEEA